MICRIIFFLTQATRQWVLYCCQWEKQLENIICKGTTRLERWKTFGWWNPLCLTLLREYYWHPFVEKVSVVYSRESTSCSCCRWAQRDTADSKGISDIYFRYNWEINMGYHSFIPSVFQLGNTYFCSFYAGASHTCLLLFSDISKLRTSDSAWRKLMSVLIHFPDCKEKLTTWWL